MNPTYLRFLPTIKSSLGYKAEDPGILDEAIDRAERIVNSHPDLPEDALRAKISVAARTAEKQVTRNITIRERVESTYGLSRPSAYAESWSDLDMQNDLSEAIEQLPLRDQIFIRAYMDSSCGITAACRAIGTHYRKGPGILRSCLTRLKHLLKGYERECKRNNSVSLGLREHVVCDLG